MRILGFVVTSTLFLLSAPGAFAGSITPTSCTSASKAATNSCADKIQGAADSANVQNSITQSVCADGAPDNPGLQQCAKNSQANQASATSQMQDAKDQCNDDIKSCDKGCDPSQAQNSSDSATLTKLKKSCEDAIKKMQGKALAGQQGTTEGAAKTGASTGQSAAQPAQQQQQQAAQQQPASPPASSPSQSSSPSPSSTPDTASTDSNSGTATSDGTSPAATTPAAPTKQDGFQAPAAAKAATGSGATAEQVCGGATSNGYCTGTSSPLLPTASSSSGSGSGSGSGGGGGGLSSAGPGATLDPKVSDADMLKALGQRDATGKGMGGDAGGGGGSGGYASGSSSHYGDLDLGSLSGSRSPAAAKTAAIPVVKASDSSGTLAVAKEGAFTQVSTIVGNLIRCKTTNVDCVKK